MYKFNCIGSFHAMLIAICQSSKFVTGAAVPNNTIFTLEEMMKMEAFATSIVNMVHGGCENVLGKERTCSTMPKGGSGCTGSFKPGARRVEILVKHPCKLVMCDFDWERDGWRKFALEVIVEWFLGGRKITALFDRYV